MAEDENRACLPGDERFFYKEGPFPLSRLVEATGADMHGEVAQAKLFAGVAPLHEASAEHVSFFDNRRYLPLLEKTQAGAVIVGPAFVDKVPEGCTALVTKEPYLAWSRIARLFHPRPAVEGKQHPTSVVGDGAVIGRGVEIGPFAVIGCGAHIGDGCVIGAHSVIGERVEIGAQSIIGPHVTVTHALLGERVILYPGARIGQDGFGFAVGPQGFESVPQLGRVIIGDGVEVGANSTIDRGSMRDTIIGAGTRIDNLVQIGHNAQLGRCCIVVAQAGVSGSTIIEDFVTIAAQAGLAGHLKIGTKARIGAQCGVMSDVDAGADVIGSPAMPFREFFRNIATLRKLSRK